MAAKKTTRKKAARKRSAGVPEKRTHPLEKYPPTAIEEALRRTHGVKGTAAKLLGCDVRTINAAIKRYPALAEIRDEEVENLLDVAETQTYLALSKGRAWAVTKVLRIFGHRRGLVEHHKIEGPEGGFPIRPDLSAVPDEVLERFLDALGSG